MLYVFDGNISGTTYVRWYKWDKKITFLFTEWRWKYRHQPDPIGESIPRRAQHPQSLRDIHGRPDLDPEAQGRQERRGVGAVPQHRRGAQPGQRHAGEGQLAAREGTHAQELLKVASCNHSKWWIKIDRKSSVGTQLWLAISFLYKLLNDFESSFYYEWCLLPHFCTSLCSDKSKKVRKANPTSLWDTRFGKEIKKSYSERKLKTY